MSIHISARPGEIAKIVLLAGDPLRAKYIADNYLQQVTLVSQTRNAFYFTGTYKGKQVTVGASGMGLPSIGIYSYELFTGYEVDCIIRIGTCGAYTTKLKLFDLINTDMAASESTFAKYAWGIKDDCIRHQGKAFKTIKNTAKELNRSLKNCTVHSSDIFYRKSTDTPKVVVKNKCLAVEMEAFSLFATAKHLGKTAAAILTVSDIIPTHEMISADEREKALKPMMELALESVVRM
jgi:purine-nucleoside phosphorylase